MPCHSSDAMTLVQTWWSAIAATTPPAACRLHLTYLMPLAAQFFPLEEKLSLFAR